MIAPDLLFLALKKAKPVTCGWGREARCIVFFSSVIINLMTTESFSSIKKAQPVPCGRGKEATCFVFFPSVAVKLTVTELS